MSFKIVVQPSGRSFDCEADESVLDAALKAGLAFKYSCRGGACGACKGRILEGQVGYDNEPFGITTAEMEQGLGLFCVGKPTSDLVLEVKEIGGQDEIPVRTLPSKVAQINRLSAEVMELHLKLPETERLQFLAGQYVEFILPDGRRRAFSIANAPHEDSFLQFHIRHIPGGEFTRHVFEDMKEGEVLRIEGPHGSFYLREDSQRPIIMLATGTGFGPVKGIVEHAIAESCQRPIYLYWGARTQEDLYMDELARQWAEQCNNIHYRPVLSRAEADSGWQGRTGHVQDAVLADFEDLNGYELYACGQPDMVYSSKEALMARGIKEEHCFSDAFEYAAK